MTTQIQELRDCPMPLTPEAIGSVIGYSPRTIRRVIQELNLPAAYFAHCYSVGQVRAILNRLNDEQLEALEQKETRHASTKLHDRPTSIANATDRIRDSYETRRATRTQTEGDSDRS